MAHKHSDNANRCLYENREGRIVCAYEEPHDENAILVPALANLSAQEKALLVLTTTPHIRMYLEMHDRKALEQAEASISGLVDAALKSQGADAYIKCRACGIRYSQRLPRPTICGGCGSERVIITIRYF